ncbi:MAG: DUF4190 domain-containing protein [Anaerohalosphaera sp.]|nr:DUF4190 domain-containing protein [Anaerohalosphaera sp.]
MNQITSAQELNNLLNEGKITQAEYDDLLAAMSNHPPAAPLTTPDPNQPSKFSDLAVASFVLSLMTFILGPFAGIPAIICGHIARRKTRKNPNLKGSGLAMAGLIIGYPITIFLTLLLTIVFLAEPIPLEESADNNRGFEAVEFKHFPIDNMENVAVQPGLEFDKNVSIDGNGSFKIRRSKGSPSKFILFETGPLDIHDTTLVYQARIIGDASIEMFCDIPGREKKQCNTSVISGHMSSESDWAIFETEMVLLEDEKPQNVILKVQLSNSAKTVWIDNIRLLREVKNN